MEQKDMLQSTDRLAIRLWAAFVFVLLSLSWRLWLPGFTDFPRVPIFAMPNEFAVVLQFASAVTLVGGLALICLSRQCRKFAAIVAVSFAVQFLCNQHCLQPWAWQAFIIAVLLFALPIDDAKKWIVRLVISIYVYSAIGKFDYQFVHTTGDELLNVMLNWIGVEVPQAWRLWLVLSLPMGELLVGIGLLIKSIQRYVAYAAIGLHVLLIAVFSPLGLAHQWPVVVWNLMSIVLVCWLFLPGTKAEKTERLTLNFVGFCGTVFALIVLVGPLLRPMQYWDHWLAWGLYSPSNSRVELIVFDQERRLLDDSMQPFFVPSDRYFGQGTRFAMENWSLKELGVPIYPQSRFQKAAAIKWLKQSGFGRASRVYELGPSHPLTGERYEITVAIDPDELILD